MRKTKPRRKPAGSRPRPIPVTVLMCPQLAVTLRSDIVAVADAIVSDSDRDMGEIAEEAEYMGRIARALQAWEDQNPED